MHRNYNVSTVLASRKFQLLLRVIEKSQGLKMTKMLKTVVIGQKVIFCGSKKTMMPSESSWDFFIKGLRVVRPSIPESFSFAADTFV